MASITTALARLALRPRNLNVYRHTFFAICPNDGQRIEYQLVIRSRRLVFVEDIQAACARHKRGYHEQIADGLVASLGGRQVLRATHQATAVETWRTGR